MKKLMTMIAAVATAFGLYATEEFKAGTCFNDWTGISDRTGDENLTWSASLYESTLINPAGWSGLTVPARWFEAAAGKALNVKTALGTEFVTCAPKPEIELTGDEKIYVDTLVKFTAFDEEAQFGDATAKLAVWIREMYDTDGETIVGTNLYVTAGVIDGQGVVTQKSYDCGEYTAGEWCRLTIKSLGSVNGTDTGVYGFVVYIDGKPVSCTTDKGFGIVTLSDLAAYYNANNILFPSLVKTEISSLAISGQGAIDDIAFTTEAPDFAVDMLKATITLDGVTAAQLGTITVSTNGEVVSGIDLSSGSASIYYKKASTPPTIKVEWTGAGNVLAGYAGPSTGALTITENNLTFANVYIGSKGYATIADALKEATAGDTITLSNNVEEAVTIATAVTLDLNGKVLTGDITANAALTIENSDASRIDGGKLFNGQIIGKVTATTKNLITVNGGYIDDIAMSDLQSPDYAGVVNGGQFGFDPDGFESWVELGEGVSPAKISDSPAIWEVGAFVAQNGKKAYLTLAEAAAEAVAGDTITVLADVNFEENIVFLGGGTNTAAIVFDLNNHTITNASGDKYGIVIADANVTLKNGTYGMSGTSAASLVMVGVGDKAGENGKPGSGTETFTGYLTVENVNITGSDNTSAAIKVEKGTLVVTSGTFENLCGDSRHSVKADGADSEAILNGGTFERMVEAKNSGKVYVNAGSYKLLPNENNGTVIYPEGKKLWKGEAEYYMLKTIEYVTLTIAEKGEGVESLSVTNSAGETVVSGTSFDVDDAETVAAVYTLASGYELDTAASTLEATMTADATIKVVAKRTQSDPVVPGADITTDKTPEQINADPTLKAQLLKAPVGVETTKAYLDLFKAVAGTESGTVKFVLTEAAEATLATEVANETKAIEVAKIAGGTVTTIAIKNATKGLYYTLNAAATLEGIAAVDEVLCTDGTVTFTKGVQGTTSDTARFFKVSVSATPAAK